MERYLCQVVAVGAGWMGSDQLVEEVRFSEADDVQAIALVETLFPGYNLYEPEETSVATDLAVKLYVKHDKFVFLCQWSAVKKNNKT